MLRSVLLTAAVTSLFASAALAQTVPTGFVVDTLISSGLQAPNDISFLADGRVLICNKAGAVMVYAGAAPVTIGTVANVQGSSAESERGLLSVVADPNLVEGEGIARAVAHHADAPGVEIVAGAEVQRAQRDRLPGGIRDRGGGNLCADVAAAGTHA